MANSAGLIKESIWRDRDFRALPRTAQATYCELISQKELDRAGMQPLQVSKWAKGCDEITEADIWHDLKVLELKRFVFVDEETDELFIRSYMRHADIARYPNILKNALRCASLVASEKLRHELAVELRRLRRSDATRAADNIDPGEITEPFPNPSETKINPSRTVPEGLNGSGTLSEPQGYGSGSGYLSLGRSQVGEVAEKSRTDGTAPAIPGNDPPPKFCPKHMPDGTPEACGACGAHRQRRIDWDAERNRTEATRRAAFRAEVRACPDCDDNGLTDDDAPVRCPNHDWENANA